MNLRDNSSSTELALLEKDNENLKYLLSVYPEEAVEKLLQNKDKLQKVSSQFSCTFPFISKSAMVLVCNTETCPFKQVCVLNKNGMAPNGYACPIESKMILELETLLKTDLAIEENNVLELELLYDLIDAKLLDMRSSAMLANGSIVQDIVIEGRSTIHTKDIAPEIKIKFELKKLKFSIMEEFLATRKAKSKYGLTNNAKALENFIRTAIVDKHESI